MRVQWQLHGGEAAGPERVGQLAERARRVVRDAEHLDPTFVALALEPRKMVAPGKQVVDLLDFHAAEPAELPFELCLPLVDRRAPDLRRDSRPIAVVRERRSERRLGAAVHRRGVEDATARLERRTDDRACKLSVVAERVPRAEADDGTEAPLLH